MNPPAGNENQNTLTKAIDTERIYREMGEHEDPARLLEMRQQAEKRLVEAKHTRERATAAAERSSARADVLTPPASATPSAPSATPSSTPSAAPAADLQSSPDKLPESTTTPPAAPAENAPATPLYTPDQTPPANPTDASTSPNTPPPTPEAPEGKGLSTKFNELFNKLWENLSTIIESITAKISDWFSGKKTEQPTKTTTPSPTPDIPPSSDAPPATETVAEGEDSTRGLTGDALLNNPQFKERAQRIANKIGVNLPDLYAIFKMEGVKKNPGTGKMEVDPSAFNPTSGASGLLQWIPRFAPVPVEELRRMSGLEQLEYVDKFFSPYAGKIHSFADLYRAVFYPVSLGKGEDFIFGSENKNDPDYKHKVARYNAGIARASDRPDGLIDNKGFEKYANSKRPAGSRFA